MNHIARLFTGAVVSVLIGAVLCGIPLHAQNKQMQFRAPLRQNMVFAYKYTEHVILHHSAGTEVLDSSERLLTYFITERQTTKSGGRWMIEANIDSMRTEYSHGGDTLRFNTQDLIDKRFDMSHRELLAPSALVNHVVNFTLSPYGEIIKIESPGMDDIRDQVKEPKIDAVTRERVLATTTPEYLTAVMLPWRGVMPLGRTLTEGDTMKMPLATAVDRIVLHEKARVSLENAGGKETMTFVALLSAPVRKTSAFTEIQELMPLEKVTGKIAGGLVLDQDGVVSTGWTTAKAVVTSTYRNHTVTTTIQHDTYTEQMGYIPFAAN